MADLVEKGIKFFNGDKETKKALEKLLGSLESNKKFIDDVVKLMGNKSDIDDSIASKIVKLPYVQTQIIKLVDSTNGSVTHNDLENGLKTIIYKTWYQNSEKALEKVKKDLK